MLERWKEYVNDNTRLDEGSLLIAKALQYPSLDIEYYLSILDNMGYEFADLLDVVEAKDKVDVIDTLNYYLFTKQGFSANDIDYYNPSNNYLNDVIDNKQGIPITLSILYMEVARRADITMQGIGFPGHFLVKYQGLIIDPFNRGKIMLRDDLYRLLDELYDGRVGFDESFLNTISNKEILARILRNLVHSYIESYGYDKALLAVDMLLAIIDDADAYRDRGLLLYYKGDYEQALQDLMLYLELEPEADDAYEVMEVIMEISNIIE